MARKPRHQKPLGLRLQYLIKEELYSTFDYDGIEYRLPHSLLDDLKTHFRYNQDVAEWHKTLFPAERQKVQRIGLPKEDLNYNDGNFIE
jgi:predicted component of type VI protein secretion system